MITPDVVVLIPGFLGFTRFAGFYYFVDRLIAVLRGLLEEPLGCPVAVVPVTTLPTDSLGKSTGRPPPVRHGRLAHDAACDAWAGSGYRGPALLASARWR